MATISGKEFFGGKKGTILGNQSQQLSQPKSFMQKSEERAVGFVKSGLETAIGTAQLLQGAGQRVIAGVDPTRNLEQVRAETGFPSLSGVEAERQREMLKAKTPEEKQGKAVEFIAELIYPVGKTTEVAGLVSKGKTAITASLDNLVEKAQTISDDVMEGGMKVKDRLIELASKLDEKTKTALTRTPREVFDKVVEQGKKAMTDDRISTPIENVGKSLVEQAQKVKNRLTQIGKQKSEVLNKAKNAYQDVSKEVGDTILYFQKNLSGLDDEGVKFVNEIIAKLKPHLKSGKLKNVDSLIDNIQDNIYKLSESEKAVTLTDNVMRIVRGGIEGLNKKLQTKVGGSYQNLNQKYSEILNLLTDVNRAVGRRGERAGSFMKQFFSPAGQTAKNIIEKMEKITNVDFSRDARLSKFIMEALGDRRVESLLEQIPTTRPTGAIDAGVRLLNYVIEKTGIKDPLEAARIFIEKQSK